MEKEPSNIFEAFEETYKKYPYKELIYYKEKSTYTSLTYRDLYYHSLNLANLLKANAIQKDDVVAIILENSPYWPVAFLGLMRIGAVALPLNPEQGHSELKRFIVDADSRFIITSSNIEPRIKESLGDLSLPIFLIDSQITLKKKQSILADATRESFIPEHTASIVYTSGTTASAKGVVLSHKNLLANAWSLRQLNLITPEDNLICLLPLYHSYPFMVNLLLPILSGASISFPDNLNAEEILECLKSTGVTIMIGVPRIFNLFYEKINKNIKGKFLLNAFLGFANAIRKTSGINLSRVIMNDLHKKFGGNLRFMISGGAKLNIKVAQAFYKWGFTILEGYGLTEASPVVTFNLPDDFKFGSVGKSIVGVAIKINQPDESGIGEVLVKGRNITPGYYKDVKLTEETIKDNWLYTRDLGYIDDDGFLFITGRKNETIVLSSGKKINPEELEAYYNQSPFIKELCIFLQKDTGDRDLLTAVILPDLEYCNSRGVSQIKDRIRFEIENLSRDLPAYQRIAKYIITNERLPRTLLGKIKRFEVENIYSGHSPLSMENKSTQSDKLSEEDLRLLSLPLSKQAIEYLSKKLKRQVNLDDHLELDLGLDSLERIGLFFEFQKLIGSNIDERPFFSVSTVRDVLSKLNAAKIQPQLEEASSWQDILNRVSESDVEDYITVRQSPLAKIANLILIILLKSIMRSFLLIKVKGKGNIPSNGPFIFCPNHTSYLDAPVLVASLSIPTILNTYFLGYSAYLNHPLLAWGKKLLRLISIDPASKFDDSLKLCAFALRNSKILCMFPEGARSVNGELQEFKRGAGILIKELAVPVVPVYIRGTYESWPVNRTFPKPCKIEVIFGEKMTMEELTQKSQQDQDKDIDIYQIIVHNLSVRLLYLKDFSKEG